MKLARAKRLKTKRKKLFQSELAKVEDLLRHLKKSGLRGSKLWRDTVLSKKYYLAERKKVMELEEKHKAQNALRRGPSYQPANHGTGGYHK